MPSPFPGMDPYLESDWMPLHHELCSEIARQLSPKLRPKYVARPNRRFLAGETEGVFVLSRDMHPDVGVHRSDEFEGTRETGTTVLGPLQMATVIPTKVPHSYVEIRDAKSRELVTAIELLSPANKRGRGRRQYLSKRRRILLSTVHLLEIDLLRRGQRVPMREPLPDAPYFVVLSRYEKRPISDVWPILLRSPLPIVPVPLGEGDADVELDLKQALDNVYDALGLDLDIDYRSPPEIPLSEDDNRWAEELLRSCGLRK